MRLKDLVILAKQEGEIPEKRPATGQELAEQIKSMVMGQYMWFVSNNHQLKEATDINIIFKEKDDKLIVAKTVQYDGLQGEYRQLIAIWDISPAEKAVLNTMIGPLHEWAKEEGLVFYILMELQKGFGFNLSLEG